MMAGYIPREVHINTDENDNEEFYFESDHVALRGNADYSAVLRTLSILEAQRTLAIQALDKLLEARKSLEDPEGFLKKLRNGELDLPGPILIAEIPKIDFEKYNVKFPHIPTTTDSSKPHDVTVRGRLFDETKPQTFNKLWTCEEQRRLEQLLIEYPPEPIEMRRFAKIARALGNRTTKQVASRVQKFFKKLHSAGMPVPGRLPKTRCRLNQNSKNLFKPSTFFPAHDVPVKMPEDDAFMNGSSGINHQQKTISAHTSTTSLDKGANNTDISGFLAVDEESDDETETSTDDNTKISKILQRVRRDKEKETPDRPQSKHVHYECNLCKEESIIGTRWHCNTCTQESIDFCSDCFVTQAISKNHHPFSHKFVGLRVAIVSTQNISNLFSFNDESDNDEDNEETKTNEESNNFYDKDYLPLKFSKNDDYNYLDPNFLP